MNYKEMNTLLVDGYVKGVMNKYHINVPFVIMKLIGTWHLIEYVHIMNEYGVIMHYKINIDKLFEFE